jgi:Secretion system C-terminal sorting domain
MKNLCFFFLALSCTAFAQTSFDADCPTSSYVLTDFSPKKLAATNSIGVLSKEIITPTCFGGENGEYNSIWLKWTCAESGTLTFTIKPDMIKDDIDFILYEINNINTCGTKQILRCMATGTTPGVCEILGETGLREGATDVSEQAGCSSSRDNFLKPLDMEKGVSYALIINNSTSSQTAQGVRIDFGGTGKFAPKVLQNNDISKEIQAKIFPSPSDSPSFTFAYNGENIAKNTIDILNICGQTIFHQDNISNNSTIDLPEQTPSGVYFVRFTANEKTTVLRWELVQ